MAETVIGWMHHRCVRPGMPEVVRRYAPTGVSRNRPLRPKRTGGRKPEESHYQTLPRWRGQNGCQDVFLFAVSFANLPFHPVSFYSPFETSFRHGHQYGYKRSRGFYGNRHEDYAERKGRHGFAASGEQSVYDAFATQALRFMK